MSEQETRYNSEEERIKEILVYSPLTKILLNKNLRQTGQDVWWSQIYNQDQRFWENFPTLLQPSLRDVTDNLRNNGRESNILIANNNYNHWGVFWSIGIGFETKEPELFLPHLEALLKEFNIIKEGGNLEQTRAFIKKCVQFGIDFRTSVDEDEDYRTPIPDIFKEAISEALEKFE